MRNVDSDGIVKLYEVYAGREGERRKIGRYYAVAPEFVLLSLPKLPDGESYELPVKVIDIAAYAGEVEDVKSKATAAELKGDHEMAEYWRTVAADLQETLRTLRAGQRVHG